MDVDVAPPVGAGDDQRQRFVEHRHGRGQAAQVLAGFDGADEQQIALGQPVERTDARDLRGSDTLDVDAERHQPQAVVADPGERHVVEGGLAAAEHHRGVPADVVEAAHERAHTVLAEVRGFVHEREVVQGDDERRIGGARDEAGGVGDLDRPGGALDLRPADSEPGLVQPGCCDRQVGDRHVGHPRVGRQVRVTAGQQVENGALLLVFEATDGADGGEVAG